MSHVHVYMYYFFGNLKYDFLKGPNNIQFVIYIWYITKGQRRSKTGS